MIALELDFDLTSVSIRDFPRLNCIIGAFK